VIDNINANGIMFVQSISNLQLGAYSINTGYQNRLLIPLELKEPPKETDTT